MNNMKTIKRLLFILFLLVSLFGFREVVSAYQQGRDEVKVTFYSVFPDEAGGTIINEFYKVYGTKLVIDLESQEGYPEGYQFAYWLINGKYRNDLAIDYQFRVTEQMEITAIFRPIEVHAVLFLDANGSMINYQYVSSGEDAIEPNTDNLSKPGYVKAYGIDICGKDKWDKPLTNITKNTVITLQYVKLEESSFTLTINGETLSDTYDYNQVVTVNAPEPDVGKYFSHWLIDNRIVSTEPSYSFSMLMDTEITAVYSDVENEDLPLVTLSNKLNLRTGYDSYMGQFYAPAGYEVIEYGLISLETIGLINLGTEGITRMVHNSANPDTNEFLTTIQSNPLLSVRAYLVCEYLDENDVAQLITVYNEFTPVSISITGETIIDLDIHNTIELAATVNPNYAKDQVFWSSSNENIATVDQNGVVTAVSLGTVTIIVTSLVNPSILVEQNIEVIIYYDFGLSQVNPEGVYPNETLTFKNGGNLDKSVTLSPIIRTKIDSHQETMCLLLQPAKVNGIDYNDAYVEFDFTGKTVTKIEFEYAAFDSVTNITQDLTNNLIVLQVYNGTDWVSIANKVSKTNLNDQSLSIKHEKSEYIITSGTKFRIFVHVNKVKNNEKYTIVIDNFKAWVG